MPPQQTGIGVETTDMPINLCYSDMKGVMPLPDWAAWFINAGAWLGRDVSSDTRLVVAIALPTRAHAAALLGFGLVCGRTSMSVSETDLYEHIARLRALPIESPVAYRAGSKRYKGRFLGFRTTDSGEHIGIFVGGKGSDSWWQPIEYAYRYEPIDDPRHIEGKRISARRIGKHQQFLIQCCGSEERARMLISHSRLECIIVGQPTLLHPEITETSFVSNNAQGTLQEVLRADSFLRPGEAYRSTILPMSRTPECNDRPAPHIVIFDGAKGFLRWRDQWPSAHQAVILDYTDHDYADALSEVNRAYIYRLAEADPVSIPPPPKELAVMVYREACT